MTDQLQAESNLGSTGDTGAAPISTPTSSEAAAVEKMIPQSMVNKIAGQSKQEGYERAKREFESQPTYTPPTQSPSPIESGNAALNEDRIKQIVDARTQEISQRHQQEWQKQEGHKRAEELINAFSGKITAARDRFPDLEARMAELGLNYFPNVIQLANAIDHTPDVMDHLVNNPLAADGLERLAERNPQAAYLAVKRLSDSIRLNQDALGQPTANQPLSQLKPSPTGTDSGSGSNTVSDWRSKSWLRG